MFVSHDYTRLRAVRPRVLGAECKSVLKRRFWNTLSKPELSSSGVLGCTVLVRWQGTITFPTAARARLESSVFWVRTCRGEKLIIIKPGGQNSLRLHPHDVCVVLISSPRWREGVLYDAIVFETCDQWNASGLTELHRGKVKCIIGRFCFVSALWAAVWTEKSHASGSDGGGRPEKGATLAWGQQLLWGWKELRQQIIKIQTQMTMWWRTCSPRLHQWHLVVWGGFWQVKQQQQQQQ